MAVFAYKRHRQVRQTIKETKKKGSPQAMVKRLEVIDDLKGLMMLTVVLYHSCMFFTDEWFNAASPVYSSVCIVEFARYLNTFHVQTFTMASGFIFFCLRKEKGKYRGCVKQDMVRRAKHLLIPYLLVMLFWVIPFYAYYNGFNIEQIVYKYVLGCSPSQLWFLPMLFIVFASFYFVFDKLTISNKGLIVMSIFSTGGYCSRQNWHKFVSDNISSQICGILLSWCISL